VVQRVIEFSCISYKIIDPKYIVIWRGHNSFYNRQNTKRSLFQKGEDIAYSHFIWWWSSWI